MLWAARHTHTRLPHPTVAGTLTETLQQELTQHHRCGAAALYQKQKVLSHICSRAHH